MKSILVPVVFFSGIFLPFSASAHEMFLKPMAYRLAPFDVGKVELVNGTFAASENVIDRVRMVDVRVQGPGPVHHPEAGQWVDTGLATQLTFDTAAPGTYAIGVSTRPRIFTMSPTAFSGYLTHEGVTDTLEAFKERQETGDVRERYSKHVRSIVQVGDEVSEQHRQAFNYPVEILLEQNPYLASPGDVLVFQVLRNGVPLSNQLVYASHDEFVAPTADGHGRAQTLRTDDQGRAQFSVTEAGIWYLTLIHMERLQDDPEADYESNWATVTFEVQ